MVKPEEARALSDGDLRKRVAELEEEPQLAVREAAGAADRQDSTRDRLGQDPRDGRGE